MVDILLLNAKIVDVRAKTSFLGHIAIKNGEIDQILSPGAPLPLASREINCTGLVAAPGFIDVHGHLDGDSYSARLGVMQGITTTIGGNCGLSPLNMEEYFAQQEKQGYVINQAELVGHSFSMRQAVGLADVNQPASKNQISQMVAIGRRALEQGAAGVSLGLDYSPGASLEEINAMANLAAEYGRILPVHTRLFTQNDLYSLYEMLSAAKHSGGRLLLSHFVYQYSGFGTLHPALAIVDEARAKGLDVWADSGMYTDWATYVGTATFDEQTIQDNSLRLADMVVATGQYTGARLNRDLYLHLRHSCPNDSIICFSGKPFEIYDTLTKPYVMMSTDTGPYAPGEGHPQIAGSYPRYLRKMVQEQKLLSLEEAVYKATLLPAQTFNIQNKGELAPGFDADIVLFNMETIWDHAKTPDKGKPDAPPEGIPYVFVNGVAAVDEGCFQNTKSGQVLRYGIQNKKEHFNGTGTGLVAAAV